MVSSYTCLFLIFTLLLVLPVAVTADDEQEEGGTFAAVSEEEAVSVTEEPAIQQAGDTTEVEESKDWNRPGRFHSHEGRSIQQTETELMDGVDSDSIHTPEELTPDGDKGEEPTTISAREGNDESIQAREEPTTVMGRKSTTVSNSGGETESTFLPEKKNHPESTSGLEIGGHGWVPINDRPINPTHGPFYGRTPGQIINNVRPVTEPHLPSEASYSQPPTTIRWVWLRSTTMRYEQGTGHSVGMKLLHLLREATSFILCRLFELWSMLKCAYSSLQCLFSQSGGGYYRYYY